jgi:hypothetical protein
MIAAIEKEYMVTQERCQEMIDDGDYVCDRCGRTRVPIETVDNAGRPTYWAGCFHGNTDSGHYTDGVKREVFELAEKLVCDGEIAYSHLDPSEYSASPESRLYWFQSQVSGMCWRIRRMEQLKTCPPRRSKEQFLAEGF